MTYQRGFKDCGALPVEIGMIKDRTEEGAI